MATSVLDRIRALWETKQTWPPKDIKAHWDKIAMYRERYDNVPAKLIAHNLNLSMDPAKLEPYTPVPWPRELCRFSSALLFSETPRVESEAHKDNLAKIEQVNDFGAFAVRGGVQAACDGRIGIRVIWDDDISKDTPLLTLVPDDQIIWDFRHGGFYAGGMVVIEKQPDPDKHDIYRLLETHTTGLVERHLHKGAKNELGKEVPLDSIPEFAGLAPVVHTGIDRPTLIPWENIPGHESDLFALGPLFDELNEAETLLLDRARKSMPRVFVDNSLADSTGRLMIDGYILTGSSSRMRPAMGSTPGELVHVVQPDLLAADHVQWIDHIQQLMVTCAGYSPLTWGIQGQTATVQRAVSGYAMKLSQLRTLLTRSAKEHMALEAMTWALATALAMMDSGTNVAEFRPSIQLGDGLPNDPLDGAQEVQFLALAQAASISERVKIVHRTWSDEEIEAEVDRIEDELQSALGVANGTGPAAGRTSPRAIRESLKSGNKSTGDGLDNDAPGVE